MKNRTLLLVMIRLVALLALAGPLAADDAAAAGGDRPPPRVMPVASSSPISVQYAFGVQNMTVPDADSNTFGVNASAKIEGTLPSGLNLEMDGTVFLDFDQDHLDPHHTPIWLQLHFGIADEIWQSKTPEAWHVSWVGDIDSRSNTVSSIERDLKLTPGLAAGVKFGILSVDAKLGYGYYYLVIDDDVPRERGYDRDDLKNHAWAITPRLEAALQLTPHFKLSGFMQDWHDGGTWLETKYYGALDWDLSRFLPRADLALSIEATQYNISVYAPTGKPPGYLPILPWNNDRLVKLSVNVKW